MSRESSSCHLPLLLPPVFPGRDSSQQNVRLFELWSSKRRAAASRPGQKMSDMRLSCRDATNQNDDWISCLYHLEAESNDRSSWLRHDKLKHIGQSDNARVPGIGLLNRTLKSWVERHGVRFLRGRPGARSRSQEQEHERQLHVTRTCSCSCRLLPFFHSGVAQGGQSARLIIERVRVQLPPPRPNSFRGYDLTG